MLEMIYHPNLRLLFQRNELRRMNTEATFWCVIPAAGRGTRMLSPLPKQYLPLGDSVVLLQTIKRLLSHPRIAGCVLVLAADDADWQAQLAAHQVTFPKPVLTCAGGELRADSVLAGLRALPEIVLPEHFVLVHDAARPCVRLDALDQFFARIDIGAEGVVMATAVVDSIKRAHQNKKIQTSVARELLWRAQTPQAFRRGQLLGALVQSLSNSANRQQITDESSAMERMGVFADLIEGSNENIKITTADDLTLAEYYLHKQNTI